MSCWFRSALNYFQKSASACARTAHIHIHLHVGYANEALGYLPSQDQICRGGYEVEMFKTGGVQNLADNTDSVLIQQTLALINKLG